MTKDANEIAAQYARREGLQPPRPEVRVRKPKVGTLTVWENLEGAERALGEPLDVYRNVIVDLGTAGMLRILPQDTGSTYLLWPKPGWYAEFIPNDDAGE